MAVRRTSIVTVEGFGTSYVDINKLKLSGNGGKSAYQSYLDTTTDNPKKTEVEWLASLKGERGEQGIPGPQGNSGYTGAVGELEVVNNLEDGSAIKALSAEMGKKIGGELTDVETNIGYSQTEPTGTTIEEGKRTIKGSNAYPQSDSSCNFVKGVTLNAGQKVIFETIGFAGNWAAISEDHGNGKYSAIVDGSSTLSSYSYTATREIALAFTYKAANGYSIKVVDCTVNAPEFVEMRNSIAVLNDVSDYLDCDNSYSLSDSYLTYDGIWRKKFDGILRKGGKYTISLGGTCALTYAGNYIKLLLTGVTSGVTKTFFEIRKDNGDSFVAQDIVVYPTEDSELSIDSRYDQNLVITGTGTYSTTVKEFLPDQVDTIFEKDTLWARYSTQALRGAHDLSWHKGKLWSFNRASSDGKSFVCDENNTVVKELTFDMKETFKDSSTPELEFKSIDWHQEKDYLLIGNGKATYSSNDSYCYIFYDAEDWLNAMAAITFANCGNYAKLDFTSLGVKCYGYWAGDNNADTMFVSVNKFGDIYLVQLGKGSNDLSQLTGGGGIFSSESDANKYNGSWVVLKHWHQDEYAGDKSDHGGQYYGGYLYLGDNRTDMAVIWRITLCDDGTMKWKCIRFGNRLAEGSGESEGYVDGVCLRDGKMWANILSRNLTAVVDV